ncbi:hypothetical protein Pint_04876 [Pistacia integerrima]|uniref:Uncharacterized protein n=1 Tax=Pistacia integerrima TaxID=434235 RepID=A0ACC0Z556_9ROSI|nr:hypothetical protein Pint_04876 [Pistacia integerrima]
MLLRQQGFSGNSYKLLHGDTKEMFTMTKQAESEPTNPLSHDIAPRIIPFHHHIIMNYGKNSFIWLGPAPSINITDPKLIREIMLRYEIFQKPKRNPLNRLVFSGMLVYEGEQWFRVRKIANPAFHLDKLKDMLPKMYLSCNDMVRKWKRSISNNFHVNKILHEALRLYPPAALFTREIVKESKLGDIIIPPGVFISMPIILVHQDEEYWGNAMEFNPERFSQGVSKASKND